MSFFRLPVREENVATIPTTHPAKRALPVPWRRSIVTSGSGLILRAPIPAIPLTGNTVTVIANPSQKMVDGVVPNLLSAPGTLGATTAHPNNPISTANVKNRLFFTHSTPS
jgi:hypothetical protein